MLQCYRSHCFSCETSLTPPLMDCLGICFFKISTVNTPSSSTSLPVCFSRGHTTSRVSLLCKTSKLTCPDTPMLRQPERLVCLPGELHFITFCISSASGCLLDKPTERKTQIHPVNNRQPLNIQIRNSMLASEFCPRVTKQ